MQDLFKLAHRIGVLLGIGLVAISVYSLLDTPLNTLLTLPGSLMVSFIEFVAPCCFRSGKNLEPEERTTLQKFILLLRGPWARFFLYAFVAAMGFTIMLLVTHASNWLYFLCLGLVAANALLYAAAAVQGTGEKEPAISINDKSAAPYKNIEDAQPSADEVADRLVTWGAGAAVEYGRKNPDVVARAATEAMKASYEPPGSGGGGSNPFADYNESIY